MKTFSKRLLTMLLAVSMVFGLSGMTTFAAEAEDAGTQDASAEPEALSAADENAEEAAGSEAASESETEADNTAAVSETVPEEVTETAVVSEDGNAIATYEYNGEYPDIPVYKNGEQVQVITGEHFKEVETVTDEQPFDMKRGDSDITSTVTAKFILFSSLLETGVEADPECGALMEDTPWPTMEDLYIYMTDEGTYRMAVNGAKGSEGWYNGVTKITLGHDYDANGDCLICGHNQLDFIDYNVKYAVCLWGIEQNEDRYGNTLGLTFGPATGGDYTNDYVAHISQEEYEAGKICLHWMTWDEIIEQSEEDPEAFDDCFKNGCTHSVNLKLNTTLLATSYQTKMDAGDGAGMLYDSLNPTYRCWNTANEDSVGWPASLLRATLNGKDSQTGDSAADALDSSDCLLSCFPTVLQNSIVAAAVTSDTVSDSQAKEDAQTTYDKLWVPSGKEVYGEGSDRNAPIRANEGMLSQRSAANDITTTDNYDLLANCDETGTAGVWRLRSLSTDSSMPAYVYQVAASGSWGYSSYNATEVGVAPCFCLLGNENAADDSYYDVKYAVSVWGINHDIDKGGHILGLTFGPATGADYRHDYVAHIKEEDYVARKEAGEKVYCIHWMTWAQIAEQAAKDPTVFEECMEKGCTHSVNLTLNDTIMGASYANQMNDGDGVSGLFNCIKLWQRDPPYEYISESYRYWNSSAKTDGGWPASQMRAVLNGEDDLLGEYAAYVLDKDDCLFSCFPYVLQVEIVPKAVSSSTVRGSEEKEDITLTDDNLWLFSAVEVWGHGEERYDAYLNPTEGALYERSAWQGVTTSNYLDALQNYDEDGTERQWFLRSMYYNSYGYVDVVNNTRDYPYYTSANSGSVSCAPGFCLGVTNETAGDKSALKAEYDADSELEQDDYTAKSWEPFAAALADAKALLDAGAVTQEPLDAALNALEEARKALESAVNKTRLQAEYEEDILLKEERYTAESWEPFANALAEAEEILDEKDPEAFSQQEVDDALAALQAAKDALVRDFTNAKVSYAVKIWGIGADKYSNDKGNVNYTTGLTFGPATGDNESGDGTGYVKTYKAHVEQEMYEDDADVYCIHWMDWDEIIAQSKKDPSVFESCLEYGCTKAVELTPNEKLFSMTTLDNYLDQGYTGDGVSTLYYLLNGTESVDLDYGADRSYGANWNYTSSGYSSSNPANLYSTSRLRVTLNGDSKDAELKFASTTGDGSDLCDETNCLLSCFPAELQEAIVPRESVNSASSFSVKDDTTYDKLFLFSLKEGGVSNYEYDGCDGEDYGVNPEAADQLVYEFTDKNASSTEAKSWWSRSRCSRNTTRYTNVDSFSSIGGGYNIASTTVNGVSPGFSLPGPLDMSGLQEEYDEDSLLNEEDYTSWSWVDFAAAMENAEAVLASTDVTQQDVDDAFLALRNAREALVDILAVSVTSITAEGYEGDNVTLYYGDSFNLAVTVSVKPADATLAYRWYEVAEDGAETEMDGATDDTLTLSGATSDSGTYKCVVTATSDRQGPETDEASITVTVTDKSNVKYAVKIWGINADKYSYDGGATKLTAGLTFGPALGDNEDGDGTGYLNTYKAHLTKEQYEEDDEAYCIHWMTWDEIIAQSKSDPTVFADCLSEGCTKAVDLELNSDLCNYTTVNNLLNLESPYTGDGVSTLFYLINGTGGTASNKNMSYGATWNYSETGSSNDDPANVYSRSRIRTTLTGDSANIEAELAKANKNNYYYGDSAPLYDETNCLLTCFPDELQEAVVPRYTVNYGTGSGGDYPKNVDMTDTYDKLYLYSMTEVGYQYSYCDDGGTNYGLFDTGQRNIDVRRVAYEFSDASAQTVSAQDWWSRARYDSTIGAFRMNTSGGGYPMYYSVLLQGGLSPGFCLPGTDEEADAPTVSVAVTSSLEDNTMVYNGTDGFSLTATVTVDPADAELSYQWFKGEEEIPDATDNTLDVAVAEVSDSGSYTCVVTATNDGLSTEAKGEITIEIEQATQVIVFAQDKITKAVSDDPFTNELTEESVVYGALSYNSSNPDVATVDEKGLVTINGAGETTITATAAGSDEGNYDEVSASYTLTVTAVDKTALQAEYDEDIQLIKTDYTGASWTPFAEALAAAEAVLSDDKASQEDVETALENLKDAKAGLKAESADKDALEAAIDEADTLVESDYTDESWEALQEVLEAAEAVDEDPEALQSAVDAAAKDLQEALDNLSAKTADKTALEAEISEAETEMQDLVESDYTPESWAALEEALKAANAVEEDENALQSAVDKAAQDLQDAIDALDVISADKTVLDATITAAETLEKYQDYYTTDSWDALQAALTTAKEVSENDKATQSSVDSATTALLNAFAKLVPEKQPAANVDKTVLNASIAAADALNDYESYYTDASWNNLQSALSTAKDVSADPDATQDAVNVAAVNLIAALADLQPAGGSGTGSTYTGFVKGDDGHDYYMENGVITGKKQGILKDTNNALGDAGAWYYVIDSEVQYGYTNRVGDFSNENGWWYIKDGKVDFSANTVAKNKNGWWYVTGGKVQFGFTGLANYKNENGWWYIVNGKVDFTHNGVDHNQNGWWYVTGGKVQFGFTGLAHYRNVNGWWYIANGRVDFTYNGIASNQNGTWYLLGGKVQLNYTGTVTSGGKTYNVRNGKVS